MRIGLITGEYPPMSGGIADYTAILAQEFAAVGHDVFVLTSSAARVEKPPDSVHVSPTVTNWNRAFFGAVNGWASGHRLDVVNLQYQTAAFQMAGLLHFLPSRFRNTPFITTFHDLRFPYLFPKAGPLRPWIVTQLARRSAGCIVTNRGDEARLRDQVASDRLARIALGATVQFEGGVSAERHAMIRAGLGFGPDEFIVAHFGFVNAVKGVDTLIRAVAGLPQTRLLMIGERAGASDPTNIAYGAEIDHLADELGVNPVWTGYADDRVVGDYLAVADVVVLPFRDGVSLRRTSFQAALAAGCPIITTQPTDDPLPEFVAGRDVLYVPAGDVEALRTEIVRVAGDADLRERLRIGAREAAKGFTWGHIAAQILEFYRACLTKTSYSR